MNDELFFGLFEREAERVAAREESLLLPESDCEGFSPGFEARMDKLCRLADGRRRKAFSRAAVPLSRPESREHAEGGAKQVKKRKTAKRILIAALIAALVIAGSTVALYATFNTHGDMTDPNSYNQKILSMSYKQIKRTLNLVVSPALLGNTVYDFIFALGEMKDELNAEQITDDLCNPLNSSTFHTILFEAAEYMQIEPDAARLLDAAGNSRLGAEIRCRYLDYAVEHMDTDSEEVINAVRAIADGGNKRVASEATDILAVIDPEYADKLTGDSLSDITGPLTDENRRRIQDRAYVLKHNSTPQQRQEFIDECDRLLRERTAAGADERELDCYVFAIVDLYSPESLVYLMSSDMIERSTRSYCAQMQTKTLIKMLESPLNENYVKTIINALRSVAVDTLIDAANEALESPDNAGFFSEHANLANELKNTLSSIEPESIQDSNDDRPDEEIRNVG